MMKNCVVTAALCAALAGCGGGSGGSDSANAGPASNPNADLVTYSVTGSGGATSAAITYRTSSGTTQRVVTLPWSYFRSANKGDFLYVSAQNQGSGGTVISEITGGVGTYSYSSSSAPYGIATASASCCSK